ncbi:TetR/AcrR family transcriptional regulator [Devosia limi]|uniref:Transcriptional regulator, TetR family n=1 Tax=Devosia limi DSM 17137 TaxID=1121477 RepID=A0A1M5GCL8_9HYPH|nr:TetR/AcrR family transcriptional regulator [Devosia limi]SHG01530.1 transcriptional regulator, TetR family [Devosia limi DSM 17137]
MTEAATDRVKEKRRRILDAARFLVLKQGLRATSMEAIAREARIAKPTLYAQFTDKDAVFSGIIDEMIGDLLAAYDSGMAGGGDIAERVGAALAGKYGVIAGVLAGSAHAAELYDEHNRLAGRFRAVDERVRDEIAAELRGAGVADAEALARLVLASAYGIARKFGSEAEVGAGIRLMCRRLIGPELG